MRHRSVSMRHRAVSLVVAFALTFAASAAGTAATRAPSPFAGIGTSMLFGDRQQSREAIEQILMRAREQKDVRLEAMSLLMLGMADIALHDVPSARWNLEESARRFESAEELFGAWITTCALGELEKSEARYDASAAAYAHALELLAKAARPESAFSMETMLEIGRGFGAGPEMSFKELPFPPELLKLFLLPMCDLMTRMGYGSALLEQGKIDQAEAELTKARQSTFAAALDGMLSVAMGDLRRRQWRFDEARVEYTRALRGTSFATILGVPPRDDPARISILSKLADLEVLCGRIDAALAWNDEQLALSRASKNCDQEAWVLGERGLLLFRARRFDAAQTAFEDALAVAEAVGSLRGRATTYSDLALLNLTRSNYGTAASQWEKSIELFREALDPAGEAMSWTMLSNVYSILDMHASAKVARENAAALAAQTDVASLGVIVDAVSAAEGHWAGDGITRDDVASALKRLWETPEGGQALLKPGGLDFLSRFIRDPLDETLIAEADDVPLEIRPFAKGFAALLRAMALIGKNDTAAARNVLVNALSLNPGSDLQSGLHGMLGVAWAKDGDARKALDEFKRAAKIYELNVDDLRVEEMLAGYLGSERNVYFDVVIEKLLQKRRIAEAFDFSERARARAFLQLLGNARIQPGRSADPALVNETEALRMQLERGAATGASASGPLPDTAELRARYATLLTRVKNSSAEYVSLTTVEPLSIDAIRAELPPDTTLVSYFTTRWATHVWLLDASRLQHVVLPAGRSALEQAKCWAEDVALRTRGAGPREPRHCARQLSADDAYLALFAPLRRKIKTRRLLIVPHGALHYVPFAALRDPKTHRLLLEDFTIAYAPTASALRFLREKESPVDGSALVIGEPGSDLAHVEEEITRVAAMLGTAPVLREEARESRLYDLHGGPDLLHIAAHGEYNPDAPLFSRIMLAPGGGRDGNLEVHEILGELDLSGVNLVVLSACETGVGKGSGGDDVVGFTRALLYAGTPGVIATLWKIPDAAAAFLMEAFYRRLLAGDSVADALRSAQLATMADGRYADPGNWAAFNLYGIPRGRWNAGLRGRARGRRTKDSSAIQRTMARGRSCRWSPPRRPARGRVFFLREEEESKSREPRRSRARATRTSAGSGTPPPPRPLRSSRRSHRTR